MRRFFYLITFLLVALFVYTFTVRNPGLVSINYYFDIQWDVPLLLLIMLPFFIGLALGLMLMSIAMFKSKRQAKRSLAKLAKQAHTADGEVSP